MIAVSAATLSVWQACLLGAVQGLTEFLPVSSSGHLAVVQHFLPAMPSEEKVAVDVALHLGTLVALLVYFRGELWAMARSLGAHPPAGHARRWIWLVGLATLPTAIAGLALREYVEASFDSLLVIGGCFLVTGVLLFFASAVRGADRTEDALGPRDALVVGLFQVIAILPGLSRSGSTISGALFRRTRADVAAKFSFLMAIPAVAGAIVLEGRPLLAIPPGLRVSLAAGIATALVTGFLAIALLLRIVRSGKLRYFAYYCWAIGIAVVATAVVGAG